MNGVGTSPPFICWQILSLEGISIIILSGNYLFTLDSAMSPAATIANEEAVAESIKKRLASTPDGTEKALRFGSLLCELQRNVFPNLPISHRSVICSIQVDNYGQCYILY